jgi:hypothetical protein
MIRLYQDGDDFVPLLEEKRKELLAISSIFDAAAGQKRPASERYGQIHPFRRQ